jgi:hypothetical protein
LNLAQFKTSLGTIVSKKKCCKKFQISLLELTVVNRLMVCTWTLCYGTSTDCDAYPHFNAILNPFLCSDCRCISILIESSLIIECFFVFCFFLRQGLAKLPRLALNSQSSCFCLLSCWHYSVHHHTWLLKAVLVVLALEEGMLRRH